jgi:hypothetical protein
MCRRRENVPRSGNRHVTCAGRSLPEASRASRERADQGSVGQGSVDQGSVGQGSVDQGSTRHRPPGRRSTRRDGNGLSPPPCPSRGQGAPRSSGALGRQDDPHCSRSSSRPRRPVVPRRTASGAQPSYQAQAPPRARALPAPRARGAVAPRRRAQPVAQKPDRRFPRRARGRLRVHRAGSRARARTAARRAAPGREPVSRCRQVVRPPRVARRSPRRTAMPRQARARRGRTPRRGDP